MKPMLWWQKAVLYQIYPRSFMDSDGDGIGDLAGIISRLDYLAWLGIDAIWLSPIFPSPMADFGYDISDYTGIHPLFGSMDDFDRLIAEVHDHGMKLVLDLVPNHSSDRHPWFEESRSSRDNPKRDWYIWQDPAPDGGAPNNWLSVFGGSAWEWDEATGQYYYHAFLKEQPDLNWRNPELRETMLNVMRFWFGKGVDGFRIDVIWHIIKDGLLRDNPPNPDYVPGRMPPYDRLLPSFTTDHPEVHDYIARMRQTADDFPDRLLIGEIYLPIHRLVTYYGKENRGVHLPFNFQLLNTPWDARHIFALIDRYEGSLPPDGWPNWVLGNHDNSRVATRLGGTERARAAAVLLLTLRGTPTVYYGDEIGMEDVRIPPDRVRDPQELNQRGTVRGRDPERTPMQWDDSKNAGFSSGEPWLPVAEDYRERNVKRQRDDHDSMLSLHRRLLALRRAEPALHGGAYVPVGISDSAMAYLRTPEEGQEGNSFLAAINFGSSAERIGIDRHGRKLTGTVVLSTRRNREGRSVERSIDLAPYEATLVRLDDPPAAG